MNFIEVLTNEELRAIISEPLTSTEKAVAAKLINNLENSAQERALWIQVYIRQVLDTCPNASRRAAKRAAKEALASLLDARKAQERLFSRLEKREKELDKPIVGKPVPCTCRPRTKAASASALILYRQAQEQQGKGRAIPAKKQDSLSPAVKIRKHS